ncbi:hypothetical protein Y1Q_0024043 [Alligator mississippiensis]|uniref:Uncharacterized protein n=1 Tax=Alligator mississippiensis TaxID=8496 RepID=A0A151NHG7_ALLMI|nr:hypothetical protein Y1Q_0024043 [Alligator mississippiensis]
MRMFLPLFSTKAKGRCQYKSAVTSQRYRTIQQGEVRSYGLQRFETRLIMIPYSQLLLQSLRVGISGSY